LVQEQPNAGPDHHRRALRPTGYERLLGGSEVDTNPNPGFRLTAADSVDSRWGIEASEF
jgi:hypothetical protein